jgi:RIO kinase 1
LQTNFGKEIWELYEKGELHPDTILTGEYKEDTKAADVDGVMQQIQAAYDEEQARLERERERDA